MRSFDPDSKYDRDELKQLNAEDWMIKLLSYNPGYTGWGPYEDSMYKRSRAEGPDELGRVEDHGWSSRKLYNSWLEFVCEWGDPDEYNECVNFYFELDRKNTECATCEGTGYHPDAKWVSESFYKHSTPFKDIDAASQQSAIVMASFSGRMPKDLNRRANYPAEKTLRKYGNAFRQFCEEMRDGDGYWHNKITQDEAEELFKHNRIGHNKKNTTKCPPAEEINASQYRSGSLFMTHDAINSGILVEQRCKRLGLPLYCNECNGNGHVHTSPAAHVNLVLWILHPRKGASKGIEIKNIQKENLPEVFRYLRLANQRNQERFAGLPKE